MGAAPAPLFRARGGCGAGAASQRAFTAGAGAEQALATSLLPRPFAWKQGRTLVLELAPLNAWSPLPHPSQTLASSRAFVINQFGLSGAKQGPLFQQAPRSCTSPDILRRTAAALKPLHLPQCAAQGPTILLPLLLAPSRYPDRPL